MAVGDEGEGGRCTLVEAKSRNPLKKEPQLPSVHLLKFALQNLFNYHLGT